jgi:hypothetical protein
MAFARGIYILYYGNWLQLNPTIGPTFFTQPLPNASIQSWCNYNLYQKINHSIYLMENMCQRGNPEFAACLKRSHIGKATNVDVNLINLRQIDFDATPNTSEFKAILLTSNLL